MVRSPIAVCARRPGNELHIHVIDFSPAAEIHMFDHESVPGRNTKLGFLAFREGEPKRLAPEEVEQKGHQWLAYLETLFSRLCALTWRHDSHRFCERSARTHVRGHSS